MTARILIASLLALWSAPSLAAGQCKLSKYLELPVTMRGQRAIVSTQIGGKDAQFILDSGAFFSTLSRASAQTYGLTLGPMPQGFLLKGINGSTVAAMTTVKDFGLAGVTLPRVDFIVGGTDTGQAGLLGQNFLGIGDVEYDFRHGAVRLLKAENCPVEALPYWAAGRPVTIIPLEKRDLQQVHTIGWVMVNGVKMRATFDTGAPSSIMTMAAAKKAGLTPDSPGVRPDGMSTGLGSKSIRNWIGTFDMIEIGGEKIAHPKIRFGEVGLSEDMLIGIDFFLTHRVYVANKAAKMLLTYEGGPLFGINPKGASDAEGKPLDLTDTSAAPTDAEGFARRGAAFASNRKLDEAIADFDRAIALAPDKAIYLRQRAAARLSNRQPLLAIADLDKALAIDPADIDARGMRARMKLGAHDPAGAADDIRELDRVLPPAASQRLPLAGMADAAGLLDIALANQETWLKTHPGDADRPTALNGRCWVRAQLNRDLDKALDDCNAALKARPGTANYLDSRGLVHLRRGEWQAAVTDYDASLAVRAQQPWTLYCRSLAKAKLGDATGAEADRKAALGMNATMADRARKLGLAA